LASRVRIQYILSGAVLLPANSSISMQFAPPAGTSWVLGMLMTTSPIDVATGNIVYSTAIYTDIQHSMQRLSRLYGVPASFDRLYPTLHEITVSDPIIEEITNGSAVTVLVSFIGVIMAIPEVSLEKYNKLWNGFYNFNLILGSLSDDDVENVVKMIKAWAKQAKGGK